MAAGKWIGGFIGWMAGGPLGALAGYLVGSLFDSMLDGVNSPDNSGTWGSGSQRDYRQQRSYQDFNEAYQRAYRQRQQQGQRNSFLFSLLRWNWCARCSVRTSDRMPSVRAMRS